MGDHGPGRRQIDLATGRELLGHRALQCRDVAARVPEDRHRRAHIERQLAAVNRAVLLERSVFQVGGAQQGGRDEVARSRDSGVRRSRHIDRGTLADDQPRTGVAIERGQVVGDDRAGRVFVVRHGLRPDIDDAAVRDDRRAGLKLHRLAIEFDARCGEGGIAVGGRRRAVGARRRVGRDLDAASGSERQSTFDGRALADDAAVRTDLRLCTASCEQQYRAVVRHTRRGADTAALVDSHADQRGVAARRVDGAASEIRDAAVARPDLDQKPTQGRNVRVRFRGVGDLGRRNIEVDLVSGGEHGLAIRGRDRAAVGHVLGEQEHAATVGCRDLGTRVDLHEIVRIGHARSGLEERGLGAGDGLRQAGVEVVVVQIERRRDQGTRVDLCRPAEQDAVGVDQID